MASLAGTKEGWEYLLAEICIGMCLAFSILYFTKARKIEGTMKTEQQMNVGFGILFLFLFISRILDNPLQFMVNPDPMEAVDLFGLPLANQGIFEIAKLFDYDYENIPGFRNGYFVNMIFLLGLAIATFFMEKAFIPKAKHVFFILLIICATLSLIPMIPGPVSETDPTIIISPIDIFDPADDPVSQSFATLGYVSFIVIPILYFILAGKTTGDLRRNALFLAFGFVFILVDIHTVGHNFSGSWFRSVPCLLGFAMIGTITTIFQTRKVDEALVDFYTSKHICIVHKGNIKGRIFMCPTCNTNYCLKCKEAIVRQENKCWNCGSVLDDTVRFNIQLRTGEPLFALFTDIKVKLKLELEDPAKIFEHILNFVSQTLKGEVNKQPEISISPRSSTIAEPVPPNVNDEKKPKK